MIVNESHQESVPRKSVTSFNEESIHRTKYELGIEDSVSRRHGDALSFNEDSVSRRHRLGKTADTPRAEMLVENVETNEPISVIPIHRNELSSRRNARYSVVPGASDAGSDSSVCCGIKYYSPQPGTCQYQLYLTYLTLGIVFGDIGTSPLYMFSTVFTSPPSEQDVLGVLSMVLWAFIIMIPLKYAIFILMATDHGEGGSFALLALLKRGIHKKIQSNKEANERWNSFFTIVTFAGIGCVLADGVLTPATTVLGAVGGLSIVSDQVTSPMIVGVSAAILVIFFSCQRFGTQGVSFLFSPIMVIWFLALLGIGIYNVSLHPAVFQAFNPALAFNYFIVNGPPSFAILGGVFLTVTGGEALYADVGHFNTKAVRMSTILFATPCLLFCYLGQAAAIIRDPTVVSNTFYLSIPKPLFYPMLVLATLAAIIASQAMVSASFSIFSQGVRFNYIPRLTIIHTNPREYGQIYVPEVNWILAFLVIIVVVGYQNAVALGYAYGVTVSFAFFITSFLYSFAIYFSFDRHWMFSILFFLTFGFIDFCFFSANMLKFEHGGWFSVTLMMVIFLLLLVWRWGRVRMVEKQQTMNLKDEELYKIEPPVLVPKSNLVICYSSSSDMIPATFNQFINQFNIRPRYLVFLTVSPVSVPYVESNIDLKPLPNYDWIYHATNHYGYAQSPTSAKEIVRNITLLLNCLPDGYDFFPPREEELITAIKPTFITGRDKVVAKPGSKFFRRQFVDFFSFLQSFSRSPVKQFAIPDERNIEIGVVVPI